MRSQVWKKDDENLCKIDGVKLVCFLFFVFFVFFFFWGKKRVIKCVQEILYISLISLAEDQLLGIRRAIHINFAA